MKTKLLSGAALILALCSCSKEFDYQTISDKSFTDIPVFNANAENSESKTSIVYDNSKYNVSWVEGDAVFITDNGGKTATYQASDADGKHCNLTPVDAEEGFGTAPFKAIFPTSLNVGGKYVLPAVQTYVSSTAAADFPMAGTTSTTDINFTNICGIIHLGIRTSQTGLSVRKITIADASEENYPMSGEFTIDWTVPSISSISGHDSVTLDCSAANDGAGVALTGDMTYFNIAVPAGTYTPSITVETTDYCSQTLTATKSVSVVAGKYNNFSIEASEISWDIAYGSSNCYCDIFGTSIENRQLVIDIEPHMVGTDCKRGAVATKATEAKSAKILWTDKNLSVTETPVVDWTNKTLTVKGISGNGNALVAIYDDAEGNGTVLWSYHIWVPEINPGENLVCLSGSSSTAKHMPLMLGAINTLSLLEGGEVPDYNESDWQKTSGVFFQWGRKDPLLPGKGDDKKIESLLAGKNKGEQSRIAVDYVTTHPTTYVYTSESSIWDVDCKAHSHYSNGKLWAMDKTAFDPCPDGYRLPGKTDYLGAIISSPRASSEWYPFPENFEKVNGKAQYVVKETGLADGNVAGYFLNGNNNDYLYFPIIGQYLAWLGLSNRFTSMRYWTYHSSIPSQTSGPHNYWIAPQFASNEFSLRPGSYSGFGLSVRCVKAD